MIRRTTSAPHENEGGFTLVELLVVIVILGILSAVVVFAVRGADDKGKGAAVATDERTIRTAEEAYCAQAGHYATMDQLTGASKANDGVSTYKFLSQESDYHVVTFKPAPGGGACNGTGYEILCKDGSAMPNCGVPVPEVPPVGRWDPAGDLLAPSLRGVLLATDPGRIVLLGYGENGESSVYNAGDRTWLPALPVRDLRGAVAIPGSPTPDCPNCGKILVQSSSVTGPEWFLYDPLVPPVSLPPNRHACRLGSALTPLADSTVLVSGCAASGAPTDLGPADSRRAEIFDPRLPAVSPWKPVSDMKLASGYPLAVRLKGGCAITTSTPCERVLAVGGSQSKRAEIYDPSNNTWTALTDAQNNYEPGQGSMTPLSDGRAMLMDGHGQAEFYDPVAGWTGPVPCGSTPPRTGQLVCPFHHSATLLTSRRVMVTGGYVTQPSFSYIRSTTMFDPVKSEWVPAVDMPSPASASHGAVLLEGLSCAPRPEDCGKVLVAGGHTGYPGSPSTLLFSE